jgi:hypothetical protein
VTVFDLEEPKGVWFDLEGGGRIQLRLPTVDLFRSIRKQVTKQNVEYKRIEGKAERFEVDVTNEDEQTALFWDYIILTWEKFFDGNHNEIPCTKDNKIMLITRAAWFAKFLNDCLDKLRKDEEAKIEDLQKN